MPDAKWLTKPITPRSQLPRKFSHMETERNVADILVLISTRLLVICSYSRLQKRESFIRWGRGGGLNLGLYWAC
jgi:hypothetical protein